MSKTSITKRRGVKKLSVELYKKLYLVRRSEETIIRYYHLDDMKTPMHMSMGQEATSVGVAHALGINHQIWTSYRSHAPFLAKTGDTDHFFGEMYGKVTGTANGKSGSMHLADPSKGHMVASAVVASGLPAAVGMAFANKQQHNGLVSCAMFGDGALDEGVFWESLNVASLMKLPVLFVCEDNGLAVHTPASARQGYRNIDDVVKAFRCTVISEDTTDVERIYRLTQRAMKAIASNEAPAFLHLKCYRYLEHVGINEDFDAGYRSRAEFEDWKRRDSVAIQQARLLEQGMPPDELAALESAIDSQIEGSIAKAMEAPFPPPEELFIGVFYENA